MPVGCQDLALQKGRRRPDGAPAALADCLGVHGLHNLVECSTPQRPAPPKHVCQTLMPTAHVRQPCHESTNTQVCCQTWIADVKMLGGIVPAGRGGHGGHHMQVE